MRTARILMVDHVPLVFGLDWLPLLGDRVSVRAQARRHGASHRVMSGDPPAAMGLAARLTGRQKCWSAAALFCRLYPRGTVACMLQLDEHSWHVLASHEGVALVRADHTYMDPEQARQAIEALRLAHPRLQVIAAQAGQQDSLLSKLAGQADESTFLQPLPRTRLIWWGLSAVLTVLLLPAFLAGRSAAVADVAGDATLAWQRSIDETLASRPLHGIGGTRALLHSLYEQPGRIAGWVLHNLRCQPQAVVAEWLCTGEYLRHEQHADNRGILQAAPQHWRLDFPSLDTATATWSLKLPSRIPDPAQLPARGVLARDWASELQNILPAFSTLRLDSPRPLVFRAPRDEQGRELPAPGGLVPSLNTRSLHIEGPLHSGVLLLPLTQPVSWHKAVLSFAPGTRPGARASRLILQLEGLVYENHS